MPTFSRVRRERGPALRWAPSQDTYYEMVALLRSDVRAPLYVTQAAILELEAHLRESASPLPFGLLAGDVCLCPRTTLEYLLIDTVSRARVELGEDDPYGQLAAELQRLTAEQSTRHKLAIGWYLGGLSDDLSLDDEVARMHLELFPERWQVVLVRGRDAGIERGALLRYESIWSRWYATPFYESLPGRAGHEQAELRTAIRWENYDVDQPARPLEVGEVSIQPIDDAPTPRSWWRTKHIGTSLEPFRRAVRDMPARPEERTRMTNASTRSVVEAAPQRAEPHEVASRVGTAVSASAPQSDVQYVFIDGSLVPAPVAYEFPAKPGTLPPPDRRRISSLVVGAVLVLALLLLYVIAR